MKVIVCDNCDKRIDKNKLGNKYVSLSVYERKILEHNTYENNYMISEKEICYDCFESNLTNLLTNLLLEEK